MARIPPWAWLSPSLLRASYYFSPFRWQPQPKLEFATEHRALIPGQAFLPLSYFLCPQSHTRLHLTSTLCGVDFLHFGPRGCMGWSVSNPHQWPICPPMCHMWCLQRPNEARHASNWEQRSQEHFWPIASPQGDKETKKAGSRNNIRRPYCSACKKDVC